MTKETVFKSKDFKCLEKDCIPFNIHHAMNGYIPLDGFDFSAWERGYSFPKKVYKVYTFLVKRRGQFVWSPYNIEEIKNLMGE